MEKINRDKTVKMKNRDAHPTFRSAAESWLEDRKLFPAELKAAMSKNRNVHG
ncbi:MAG: hypothetical protein J6O71_01275 [Lachnospiraceae bacterium]|nr:hypothetical protein [Lachnospiraceae bacterium]